MKVRTETYNAMLAAAKRGLKSEGSEEQHLGAQASDEISVGSQYAEAGRAGQDVSEPRGQGSSRIRRGPCSPQRELKDPLGWKWNEEFTDLDAAAMPDAAAAAAAANDARRMLTKPAPKRPPPKL